MNGGGRGSIYSGGIIDIAVLKKKKNSRRTSPNHAHSGRRCFGDGSPVGVNSGGITPRIRRNRPIGRRKLGDFRRKIAEFNAEPIGSALRV